MKHRALSSKSAHSSISTVAAAVAVVVILVVAGAAFLLVTSTQQSSTSTTIRTTSVAQASSTASSSSSSSRQLESINFGLSIAKSFEYIPVYAALHGGFWEQQGLKVNLQGFQGDAQHIQAAASGQVQMGIGSYPGIILAMSKGVNIINVGDNLPQADMVLVVSSNSKYTNPSLLKGGTISVTTAGSVTDMMFHVLASQYKFTIGKDIREAPIGISAQIPSLLSNATQGAIFSYGTAYPIVNAGQAKILLFFNTVLPNWSENTVYASTGLVSSNPSMIKKVLQGLYNSVSYCRQNTTFAARMTMEYLNVSQTIARQIVNESFFGIGGFSSNGAFTQSVIDGMNNVRSLMLQLNVSSSLPPVSQTFTTQFVPLTPQNVSPSIIMRNTFAISGLIPHRPSSSLNAPSLINGIS